MWYRIFVSRSVLHSCQPEVKVLTSAQNTRKPGSPGNVSRLLRDPSYVVISLQVVLERLKNLLFIINTLYQGLGRDKTEYPVIVKAIVRINRDWSPYKWLPWRRNCRLRGHELYNYSRIFSQLIVKMHWPDKKASCLHRGLLNERDVQQYWRVKLDPCSRNIYSECLFIWFPAPLKRTIERA